MSRQQVASLAFIYSDVETKPTFGKNVITLLTPLAASYPLLPYPIAEMILANNGLSDAVATAHNGDHNAIAIRLEKEKVWDTVFRATAKYVGTVANGVVSMITQVGFTPTKGETSPAQLPEAPHNFEVSPVKASGKALLSSKGAKGSKGYVFFAKTAGVNMSVENGIIEFTIGDQKIYVCPDTHNKKLLEGLQSKVTIDASMIAFNAAGLGDLTSVQQITPQ